MVGWQQVLAAHRLESRLEHADLPPNNRKSSAEAHKTLAMPVFYNIRAMFYPTIIRDNTKKHRKHLTISVSGKALPSQNMI